MRAKHSTSESPGLGSQLPAGYHPDAADLSAAGMGSFQDMQRLLVLPLQRDFQTPLRGDDAGGHLHGAAGEPLLHHTLHGQLLNLFLVIALSLRPAFAKWCLWTDTLRHLYR